MYTIFTGDGCIYCEEVKAILEELGLPYREFDVHEEENLVFLRIMFDLGHTKVPQVYDPAGYHVGGCKDLKEHLEYLGYQVEVWEDGL